MNNNLKTGKLGIELIKHYESCDLNAYYCPSRIPTIGWGHTGMVGGKPIIVGTTKITQQKADELFVNDITSFEAKIKRLVKVPLNQNQFDALVSFIYNAGEGNLASSTALKLLNQGKYSEVSAKLALFNKGNVKGKLTVLQGLVFRRKTEGLVFSTGQLKFFN